ncbi:hypothetical protein ACVRWE_01610 [Streptococcus urinalis]|uniref:hypothetical protein n=1 Tax=Streptococcus urinalis TaxID=149016 RepID=UPI00056B5365
MTEIEFSFIASRPNMTRKEGIKMLTINPNIANKIAKAKKGTKDFIPIICFNIVLNELLVCFRI